MTLRRANMPTRPAAPAAATMAATRTITPTGAMGTIMHTGLASVTCTAPMPESGRLP